MNKSIVFTAPDGKETVDPDAEWLRHLILHEGDAYWGSGSGDAGLRYISDGVPQAEMILMLREPLGAFVHHVNLQEGTEYVISYPGVQGKEVTIRHAGNAWTLPKSCFVECATALRAVEQFLIDGRRFNDCNWTEF